MFLLRDAAMLLRSWQS